MPGSKLRQQPLQFIHHRTAGEEVSVVVGQSGEELSCLEILDAAIVSIVPDLIDIFKKVVFILDPGVKRIEAVGILILIEAIISSDQVVYTMEMDVAEQTSI